MVVFRGSNSNIGLSTASTGPSESPGIHTLWTTNCGPEIPANSMVKRILSMTEPSESLFEPYSVQIRINKAHDLPKMDLIADGDPYSDA